MKAKDIGLRSASTIFGLVAAVQLFRVLTRARILINEHSLPLWPSIVAFIVGAALCAWLWILSL